MYAQSNGLAEKSEKAVKNLMKKYLESGDDVNLALLDLRNMPRDEQIRSPMQRLMARPAKMLLPISDGLWKPTRNRFIQADGVSSEAEVLL